MRSGWPPTGPSAWPVIDVFTTTDEQLCALPPRVSPSYIDSGFEYYPTWKNEVTLRSVEHMITCEPAGWVPLIGPTDSASRVR